MNFKTHLSGQANIDVGDLPLQGTIQAAWADMWTAFGKPINVSMSLGDCHVWVLKFEDGRTAAICGWMQFNNVSSAETLNWRIRGQGRDVAALVHEAFRQANGLLAQAA